MLYRYALPLRLLYGRQIKIGEVSLRFSTVKYVMRSRPDEAEETLERLIDPALAVRRQKKRKVNDERRFNPYSRC